VNQAIYKEMRILGLLTEKPIRDNRTHKIIGAEKNYIVKNKHKNSRAKSYEVEEPVYEDYIRTIG
jgi:hypothetical protein